MEKDAGLYEIGYLFKDGLGDEEILSFSENLRNTITDRGGLITTEGKPKKQNLAYPIKKETTAIFNWLRFMVKPALLGEIEKYLKEQKTIIRFIVVKTVKEKAQKPRVPRLKKTKLVIPAENDAGKTEKEEIKEEEIDKKIEELLGE